MVLPEWRVRAAPLRGAPIPSASETMRFASLDDATLSTNDLQRFVEPATVVFPSSLEPPRAARLISSFGDRAGATRFISPSACATVSDATRHWADCDTQLMHRYPRDGGGLLTVLGISLFAERLAHRGEQSETDRYAGLLGKAGEEGDEAPSCALAGWRG